MNFVEKRRNRLIKRNYILGLKGIIEHALLQLYKMEDNDTAENLISYAGNLDLQRFKIDIYKIQKEALEILNSGRYEEALSNMTEQCGSYTATIMINDIVGKLNILEEKKGA